MILAATGHRPDKLGGYSEAVEMRLIMFALRCLLRMKPDEVISGMALGWDMAVAEAAIIARIPLTAAVPFDGQEKIWPRSSQFVYSMLLEEADRLEIISPGGYAPWKMMRRNEWMMKNCDHVLALWNGTPGGTADCIEKAHKLGLPITNVWEEWAGYTVQRAP